MASLHASDDTSRAEDEKKDETTEVYTVAVERQDDLQRALSPRMVQMIAVGGIVGSGYWLGTGAALNTGGPVGLLLGYTIMGMVTYTVIVALGEMVTVFPLAGGFVYLANRFVDPALGAACGMNYWYGLAVTIPAEISAGSLIISFWETSTPVGVWITMFLVVIVTTNMVGVRWYGETEFYMSLIKIVTIIGLLILFIIIDLGGVPTNPDRLGFRYWINPGPFVALEGIAGSLGQFLGFWSVFVNAAFSYGGVEVIALTAAESTNPHRSVPRAVRTVFWRILVFYVGGVFLMGLCVPSDNPDLLNGSGSGTASPFVIGIVLAGIPVLPSIINTVILLSTFSAGNSYLYAASRTLYGLAVDGQAPAIFRKTTSVGLPWVAVLVTGAFGLLAFMNLSADGATVFAWLYTLSAISCLLAWVAIMVTYLRFYAGLKYHNISRDTLPYKAPMQPYLSWAGLSFIFLIVFFNGFELFLQPDFDTSYFIASYSAIPIFVMLGAGWKFYAKTTFVTLEAMDFSGMREACVEADAESAISNWRDQKGPLRKAGGLVKKLWE